MTPVQRAWLETVCKAIPRLFDAVGQGAMRSSHVIGERTIRGRKVRMSFVVEVVDPGTNPLRTHSSGGTSSPE